MFKKILATVLSAVFIVLLPACVKEKEDDYGFTDENANGFYDEKDEMNSEAENPNSEITVQSISEKKIEPSTDGFIIPVETVSEVPENYIGIYSVEDLDNIRYNLNANYILMRDLDLSNETIFNPIEGFLGVFDGNGYKIRGVKCLGLGLIERSVGANILSVGLFASAGEIKNLAIENISIEIADLNEINTQNYDLELRGSSGLLYVGAIASKADKISNCYVTGTITLDEMNIPFAEVCFGSVAGEAKEIYTSYSTCTLSVREVDYDLLNIGGISGVSTTVNKCFYDSQIFADCRYRNFEGFYNFDNGAKVYAGGVTGYIKDRASNCYNNGTVTVEESDAILLVSAGGVTGFSDGIIEKSYNTGTIRAKVSRNDSTGCFVGGVLGRFYTYVGSHYVTECYNTGYIVGHGNCDTYVGGIIGVCDIDESIFNCFNKGNVMSMSSESTAYSGGIAGNNLSKIYACYNMSGVASSGVSSVCGAICGGFQSDKASIENCYYNNADLNGVGTKAMFTTVKYLDEKSFQKISELKGFEFAEDSGDVESAVWIYLEGKNDGYPILKNTYLEENRL